ncbi:MAG: DUF2950 family protein [Planctomycetota bacterium]
MDRTPAVVLFVFAASLPAQQRPAPAGETVAVFTACEAFAFAHSQQIAAEMRGVAPASRRNEIPGYRVTGGELPWQEAPAGGQAGPGAVRVPFVYLVPATNDGSAVRVFCVRGDGALAFTDNTARTGLADGREPEVDDALGEGGVVAASNFPRTPTRGRDGNLWLPEDLVRTTRVALRVVDESGAPMGMVRVALEPADDAGALDVPLPAGTARTFHEGDAVISGAPARGLGVVIEVDAVRVPIDRTMVTAGTGSLRITAPRAAIDRARISKNEAAAIATLKNISSAQAQCQASCAIDVNKNGAGEYGTFAELTGRDAVRGGDRAITPPVLSRAFTNVMDGAVVRSGYCFRIFLPGQGGNALAEMPKGGASPAVDAAQAETLWCAYAWPVEAGASGQRAFFIDQAGDVLACPNADGRYAGVGKAPVSTAARAGGTAGKLTDRCAANVAGLDGQNWIVVN